MRPEGWKGSDALNVDNPSAFWDVVSDRKVELEELSIGDWIYLERHHNGKLVNKQFSVVRERWVNDEGETEIRFSDPTPDDHKPAVVTTTFIGIIP